MMEAARTSETSVDNHFTRQYNPEDSSEHRMLTGLISMTALVHWDKVSLKFIQKEQIFRFVELYEWV
jgi:hypothetical protein